MITFKAFLEEACWKGYKQYGMKKKGNKEVPNCVPEEVELDEAASYTLGGTIDKSHTYKVHRSGKNGDWEHNSGDEYHSLADAQRVARNMKKGSPLTKTKITKHARTTLAGPKGKLPEEVELDEAKSPAWQRSAGKNPEGGLNQKGVDSYRREHPGSKLKTAVTTKPSKLDPDSKSAKRRKSFCARMGGMKKRLTSSKTANDPDSRINKALRKWNC